MLGGAASFIPHPLGLPGEGCGSGDGAAVKLADKQFEHGPFNYLSMALGNQTPYRTTIHF